MSTILIVEDEPDLRELVLHHVQSAGLTAMATGSGVEALRMAAQQPPDLVLLDLMLPDLQGVEVCKRLRADAATATVPIIMLTARTAETDRIAGFEAGADDYVSKPFSTRELMLRIRAVLRRRIKPDAQSDDTLAAGGVEVDQARHLVKVDGEEVKLTALEFRLLATLIQRRGRVQTRQVLLQDVWDMNPDLQTRTVDTHVKRLRERLGPAGDCIETVRGVGYCFRTPQDK
jgi:two-component system phosphate regulon response regulator PhoB